MSCFWNTLIKNLNLKKTCKEFIIELKNKNTKTKLIKWNNIFLSNHELKNNYKHINLLNENLYNSGYDCSTCDPVLLLISKLYNVNINHQYLNNIMKYENCYKNKKIKTIFLKSDKGHMWS